MGDLHEKIISIIQQINPYEEIQADTELIKSGILDSLEIFELVSLIETEFDIEIPEELFVPESFSSVTVIIKLVDGLLKQEKHQ